MEPDNLYFIQPHIIERFLNGQFVAQRRESKSYKIRDRRNMLSPLNITRRAIRYEPLVAENRREQIIESIYALNDPDRKLLLVGGPSGRGKTTFVRMLVEFMGGGKEQLLWFDVSRHTDFDEVIRFLVESMTELCRAMLDQPNFSSYNNPVSTLDNLLKQTSDFPILIVVDNIEYLVTPDKAIRSRELKDALNFLLSFPNIKLIFAGKRLPYNDMNSSAKTVLNLELPSLNPEQSEVTVKRFFHNPVLQKENLSTIINFFNGEPLLLFVFAVLFEKQPDEPKWLEQLRQNPEIPSQVLIEHLYQHLSIKEQNILSVLSMVRHGLTPSGMEAVINFCQIDQGNFDFKLLDRSMLRLILRKVYPPQMVIDKLRNRNKHKERDAVSIEACYQLCESFQNLIANRMSEADRTVYHERLQKFYLAEKDKHILNRIYKSRTVHLAAEAQYHQSRIKKSRRAVLMEEPFMSSSFDVKDDDISSEKPSRSSFLEQELPDTEFDELDESLFSNLNNLSHATYTNEALEPVIYMPSVRLSEDDLHKLSELVTKVDFTSSSIQTSTKKPDEEYDQSQTDHSDLAQISNEEYATLSDEQKTDPEEKLILDTLNEAILRHDRKNIAKNLIHLAQQRIKKGLFQNALSCLLKALEFAETEGLITLEMKINALIGHYYQQHFQHNKAIQYIKKVELIYENSRKTERENYILAFALRDMGVIQVYRKNFVQAVSLYQKSITLSPGRNSFHADVFFRIGLVWDEAGEFDKASNAYERSFEISSAMNNSLASAATLYNLGSLYFEQSRFKQAQEIMERCLFYDRKNRSNRDVFYSLILLSRINEAQKLYDKAEEYAKEAYNIALQVGRSDEIAMSCVQLGQLAEKKGLWQQSARFYREAKDVAADDLSEESRYHIHQKLQYVEKHLL